MIKYHHLSTHPLNCQPLNQSLSTIPLGTTHSILEISHMQPTNPMLELPPLMEYQLAKIYSQINSFPIMLILLEVIKVANLAHPINQVYQLF